MEGTGVISLNGCADNRSTRFGFLKMKVVMAILALHVATTPRQPFTKVLRLTTGLGFCAVCGARRRCNSCLTTVILAGRLSISISSICWSRALSGAEIGELYSRKGAK